MDTHVSCDFPIVLSKAICSLQAVYEHHPRPKQLIVEHDLQNRLQKLIEERRDGERSGGQVLVKQVATALLKALHINTVL